MIVIDNRERLKEQLKDIGYVKTVEDSVYMVWYHSQLAYKYQTLNFMNDVIIEHYKREKINGKKIFSKKNIL